MPQLILAHRIVAADELLDHFPREHREVFKKAFERALSSNGVKESFSAEDVEILKALAADSTIAEVAKKMGRAESTILGRIRQLKNKLGCRGLAGLVAVALRKKIIA